jgi:hypothetical protein
VSKRVIMILYHGTNIDAVEDLISGQIDVNQGGGEFGQGFYTGNSIHLVSAWAWHRSKQDMAVISYDIDDMKLIDLRMKLLSNEQARNERKRIKDEKRTRAIAFKDYDIVIGPVVGRPFANYMQFVFVGSGGQNFINGQKAEQLWQI